MAPGRVERGGRVGVRYDALTGGSSGRVTYFLICRRLRILPSQFDAEPWWSQRLILEELKREIEQEEKSAKAQKRGKGTGSLGQGSPQRVDAGGDLANSPFQVRRADQ